MPKYEINVWKEIELISKEVTYFEDGERCASYVNDKYNSPDSWTQTVTDNGQLHWKPQRGIRVTWGKLPEYNYKPKKMLTSDDRTLQRKLDKSITEETIKEFKQNQFRKLIRESFYDNPNAEGYEDKK